MSQNLGDRLKTQAAADAAGVADKALARASDAADSVLAWINHPKTLGEVAKALPRGLDAARFLRQVQTEIRKSPRLLECDARLFILQVLTVAQLGLELGPLGQAYIIGPFNVKGHKESVLIVGYKGLCELAYRSDTVDLVAAFTVHEGEPFKVLGGSDLRIEHEIELDKRDAPAVAYYAVAAPKQSGRLVFDVMSPSEVDKIRARSKAKDEGPWVTDYEAMAQKTVVRRLLNRGRVRLSPEAQQAIAEDEERELGVDKAILLDPALMPAPEPDAADAESKAETSTPEQTSEATASKPVSSDPGAAFRPKQKP